jgi:hypothetical protein
MAHQGGAFKMNSDIRDACLALTLREHSLGGSQRPLLPDI